MNAPGARTVPGLLAEIAAHRGDAEALVADGARWTWCGFEEQVATTARALLADGVRHGDRIGILAGNRAEWLLVHFAAASLGAITVGLNTWSTVRELGYQLAHARVSRLFYEPRFRERDFTALLADARAQSGGLPALDRTVAFEAPYADGTLGWDAWLGHGAGVTGERLAAARARVAPHDVACLLYTSGSTALPKGVPLLHAGLVENMWEIGERQHLVVGDRLWLAVSLFWSLACVNALYALVTHGGTVVLQHHFDPGEALNLIESERCTVFYGTPNMALALTEHPDCAGRDLSSLRTGVTIGTPAQVRRVAALGATGICNVYGLTEAYGNSTVTDAAWPLELRAETVGTALPGVEIRIEDPLEGGERPPGEAGEILLRGRVTPGYWNDPERTAESFTRDGWFRTGDLGYLDECGRLYYRGRLKEMVKTGGINVAPAEVEAVLVTHPDVELAFVTGIPDARLDEALAAVIVPRAGARPDVDALTRLCRSTLAAYKIPRSYRLVEAAELPLTSTGKLQRNRLPELFT